MNIGGISAGYSYWGNSYNSQDLRQTAGTDYSNAAADSAGKIPGGRTAGAARNLPDSRPTGAAAGVSGSSAADAGRTIPGSGTAEAAGRTAGAAPEKAGQRAGRKSAPEECQTCKERKYQDGSDENVSFKAATHIAPEAAGAAVRAHEGEHVSNAYTKAAEKNGEVISATVSIHTAICPECGRTYVSGGTTRTSIKYPNESNPYQQNRKSQDAIRFRGQNIDYAA